jgi:hypothetical protein
MPETKEALHKDEPSTQTEITNAISPTENPEQLFTFDTQIFDPQIRELIELNFDILSAICEEIGLKSFKISTSTPDKHGKIDILERSLNGEILSIKLHLNPACIREEIKTKFEEPPSPENCIKYLKTVLKNTLTLVQDVNLIKLDKTLLILQYFYFILFTYYSQTTNIDYLFTIIVISNILKNLSDKLRRNPEVFSMLNIFGIKMDRLIRFRIKSMIFKIVTEKNPQLN